MENWREELPEEYRHLLAYCESTETGSDLVNLVRQLVFWLDNLLVDDDSQDES